MGKSTNEMQAPIESMGEMIVGFTVLLLKLCLAKWRLSASSTCNQQMALERL